MTELLTLPEAAERLHCTEWFLRTRIGDGKLSYVPMGKRHLVDDVDLNKLRHSLKNKAGRSWCSTTITTFARFPCQS
jgi:hypothetical protein